MNIVANKIDFGVNDDEEPYVFIWIYDTEKDFVFSLTRSLEKGNNSAIEYMVMDQVWEPVSDFCCVLEREHIRSQVPEKLRKHTGECAEIHIRHMQSGDGLLRLSKTISMIFMNKPPFIG